MIIEQAQIKNYKSFNDSEPIAFSKGFNVVVGQNNAGKTALLEALSLRYPQTIIIDEPQSFLHPGAVRKLIEILKQHPQHQYIVTSHSPSAITAANPKTLILLRKEDAETKCEHLDISETNKLRVFLSEVGARLSDVFGADNILWVEGKTEEMCFPRIVERIVKQPLLGTEILGVQHTGDFDGKHSKTVLEIYERLSKGRSLLPPATGFVFDRENRSASEIKELEARSNGRVQFLPRKMFENYLLNAAAISFALIAADPEHQVSYDATAIENWMNKNRWDRKYFRRAVSSEAQSNERWLREVDGAKLLTDLFNEISEARVCFDKIRHGTVMADWVIENCPEQFAEIAELLKRALNTVISPVTALK